MHEIHVNGEARPAEPGTTLAGLLMEMDIDPSQPRGIAVAVNDAVVRHQDWHRTHVHAGDRVEVVTARQGG